MSGHGEKLSRKQGQAVAALYTEGSIEAAARAIGVNEKTLRQWRKQPAFEQAEREFRQEFRQESLARILRTTRKAVDTLEACLDADRPSDRIRAAMALLDAAHRAVDQADVLGRLEALERKAKQGGKQP